MNQAGINRAEMSWERDFTSMPNAWIRDESISFKAKGLLQYLLSHNAGYELTIAQIVRQTKDGKDSIRSAMTELVDAGYLLTYQTKDARGYNGPLAYFLHEPGSVEIPKADNPEQENPKEENPTLENPPAYRKQLNKENKVIKKTTKDEEIRLLFAEFYQNYPRKLGRGQALTAFKAALSLTTIEEITLGLKTYIKLTANTDPKFIKHPATWLNGQCWADEYETQQTTTTTIIGDFK